jgi:flagellar motility protein MotE (MotC chaperone)
VTKVDHSVARWPRTARGEDELSVDPTSVDDYPLESVRTFAELVDLMIRLYAHAGEPRPVPAQRRSSTGSVKPYLAPARLRRILERDLEPSFDDLLGWLNLCGLTAEAERWRAAWGRASEHRLHERANARRSRRSVARGADTDHARTTGAAGTPDAQAEALRSDIADRLLHALRAVSDTLDAWSLAASQEPTAAISPADPTLERVLKFGRVLRDILDRAHRELASVPFAAPGADPGEDPVLTRVSLILQSVPRGISPYLVSIMELSTADALARAQPEILRDMLTSMPPNDSAEWVVRWQLETAVGVLIAMRPDAVAHIVEHTTPEWGSELLSAATRVDSERAAAVLDALPLKTAARYLAGLDRELGAGLLDALDPDAAADHLIEMDDQDLARPGEFTTHMTRANAGSRIKAIDRKRAERSHSIALLRDLEEQRRGRHGT